MKNLFQRVRDWLIKKLGGYTREEYNTVAKPPLKMGTAIGVKTVERIRAQVEIAPSEIQIYKNSDLMVQVLAQRMLPQIKYHMRIRRLADSPTYSPVGGIVVEGYITIVKEE